MPDYRGLTDSDLNAKIARYEAAVEEIDLEGATSVIAGEGRRQEFVRSNSSTLHSTLDALYAERSRRDPATYPSRGRAIGMRFCP